MPCRCEYNVLSPEGAEILSRGGQDCFVVFRIGSIVEKHLRSTIKPRQIATRIRIAAAHPDWFVAINYCPSLHIIQQTYISGRHATMDECLTLQRIIQPKCRYRVRDLFPSNVLIDEGGEPRIIDFAASNVLLDTPGIVRTKTSVRIRFPLTDEQHGLL